MFRQQVAMAVGFEKSRAMSSQNRVLYIQSGVSRRWGGMAVRDENSASVQ